jgi:hypothetical protein
MSSAISKPTSYYLKKYKDALARADEPHQTYLADVWRRAHLLSKQGPDKASEINRLIQVAKSVVAKKNAERKAERDMKAAELDSRLARERAAGRRKVMGRLKKLREARKPKHTHNLRNGAPRPAVGSRPGARRQREVLREVYRRPTLSEFISSYIEKIKHKKELLLAFLLKMYRAGYKYSEASKKWFRPRPRARGRTIDVA